MDTQSSAVENLRLELGEDGFNILVSSHNTTRVKEFVAQLTIELAKTSKLTVGGRTYEILSPLRGDEESVVGFEAIHRAMGMEAHLGEEEAQHLLDNQKDIPMDLRKNIVFIFTGWEYILTPGTRIQIDPECVYMVFWSEGNGQWTNSRFYKGHRCNPHHRVLRRIS